MILLIAALGFSLISLIFLVNLFFLVILYVISMNHCFFNYFQALLFVYLSSQEYAKVTIFSEEKMFIDAATREQLPFPSIHDKPSLFLSVIIPAYNEEKRCKN